MSTRDALRQALDCLEDVASGKGGWAWEEVLQDGRAALAADEKGEGDLLQQLVDEFCMVKWIGSDPGWDAAIVSVRGELLRRMSLAKHAPKE